MSTEELNIVKNMTRGTISANKIIPKEVILVEVSGYKTEIEIPRPNGLKKKNSFTILFDNHYNSLYRCQLGIILLPKK